MEPTTTEPVENTGVEASTQPEVPTNATAETPQEPVQSEPTQTDEVMDWVTKKGYDLSTPDGVRKLAESYQNAEKLALAKAQEASELKKSLAQPEQFDSPESTTDPLLQEFVQDYKRDKQINSFKESHPDWSQYEQPMVELLQTTVTTAYGTLTRSEMVNAGIMSLDDVYAMAKGIAPADTEEIKTQTKQEVLQTLANTQRAGGANAHATSATVTAPTVTKDNVDTWYAGLSAAERAKPENQKLLSSLLNS